MNEPLPPAGFRMEKSRFAAFAGLLVLTLFLECVTVVAEEELAPQQALKQSIESVPVEDPLGSIDRQHWSFRPLTRPPVPEVQNDEWCTNAIDRFVLHELEKRQLTPMPLAREATLKRRLAADLTGLPPQSTELGDAGSRVDEADWDQLVDQLLGSPAFGEHWGQHWLDLVRFAETDGFEHDLIRSNAWRYRDWVIEALNSGMPYDEFLKRQLAGDALYPDDPTALVATGFLLCGPDMPDLNLREERRHVFLNDMTGTVGAALLGLTMECAACHDHKYDPISQFDFYRLRGVFEEVETFQEQPIPSPEDLKAIQEFEQARADRWKAIEQEIKTLKSSGENTAASRIEDLQKELAALKKKAPPTVGMARAVRQFPGIERASSRLWVRGDFRRPGPEVLPGAPRILHPVSDSGEAPQTRIELLETLLSPENPLTARVIVNRLWTHHFGTGLCRTPNDFGIMGDTPDHEDLLNWLASELIRQEWDLKGIHRLIVTSTTYRLASSPEVTSREIWDALQQADPENRWLGRRDRRRLSGEMVRDALLSFTGTLNDDRYGPGVRPPLPAEITGTLLKNQWTVSENPADHHRRSVYLFVRRNLTFPMFQVLDKPDANRSCPVRTETTIAPQALQLMNSEFMVACAAELAERLDAKSGTDTSKFVDLACMTVWGRLPAEDERRAAMRFLEDQSPEAKADFCLTLFNTNSFLYVD